MVRFSRHNLSPSNSGESIDASEQEVTQPEKLKLQFAALFDDCIRSANAAEDVLTVEHVIPELVEPTANGAIVGKIIRATSGNEARIISMEPLRGEGDTTHIFYLRRADEKGEKSIETHFKIIHDGADIKGAKLHQVFGEGKNKQEKIIEVDEAGTFKDRHIGGTRGDALIKDPEICQPDLQVVASAIPESVETAIRHTTEEFDKVVRIDKAISLGDRLGGAATGFRTPDRLAA